MGMDVFGKNPSNAKGRYFQATIWSWRPIHFRMARDCRDLLSETLLKAMEYNDGAGPDDQETCTMIAERFEEALEASPHGFTVETNLSMRVDENGRVMSAEELAAPGVESYSPYVADFEELTRWVAFLRHCGGFSVC